MLSGNKFKRIISIITASALALAAIPAGSLTHHAEAAAEENFTFSLTGQGTADSPYLISTSDDLANMRDAINSDTDGTYSSAHFQLTQDITLDSETVWYPIGRNSNGFYSTSSSSGSSKTISFKGVFDGQGHIISGLKINNNDMFGKGRLYTFGLFGKNDGVIKNLSVKGDVNITAFYVGLICGINDGTIENCSADGSVFGSLLVGGIAGICDKDIKNCFANVKSSTAFGAIAGLVDSAKGKVENCYFNKDHTSLAILSGKSETVYGLTTEELKSGSAAWGLQNGQDNKKETVVWSQDLKTDNVPVLDSEHRVFKVSYMLGDITVAEAYANSGDKLTTPKVEYAKEGYSSGDKWFKDEDHSSEWNFDSDTVTEDISLYSERTPIEYTITLETNGGTIEDGKWQKEDNVYKGTYNVNSNDITLPAPKKDGYNFVGWTSSQEDDSTGEASATITIPQGSTGNRTYEAVYLDATAPTITITMDSHKWSALHENPTFDLYFNSQKTVSVTATDDHNEADLKISYYISNKKISDEDLKNGVDWKAYTDSIELKTQQKAIIYVKVTDGAGNSSYASTTGIVIDFDDPVITGVAENGKYCADVEFSVKDEAVAKIIVNDEVLFDSNAQGDPGVEEGPSIVSTDVIVPVNQLQPSYKIENTTGTPEDYVITVTDKAGNTATRTVTLNGGHTVWYRITEQITYPTCTESGLEYLFICCKECGGKYQAEIRPIDPLGHNWKDWETVNSPDCDDSGSQKRTCSRCGFTETQNLNPNGHDWEDHVTVDVAPTCTSEGSQSIHCKNCDQTKEQTVIPAKDHNFGEPTDEIESPATCTSDGNTIHCYVCKDCGTVLEDPEVVPALGHTYGEWEELSSGVMQRKCSVCGHLDTKDSTDSDHKWNDDWTIIKEPTCTTNGSRSILCSVCGTAKVSEDIPATGHSHDEAIKENEKLATCTEGGSYDEVIYCKNCRDELHRVSFEVSPTGHTWGEWETVASPDCDDSGTQQHSCTVCGVTETRGLEANGHTWEDHATVDVEPSCTTEGSKSVHCVNCSVTKDSEVIPALGHDWSEWTVIKMSDCDDEGTEQHICKVCSATETRGLLASGHKWNEEYTIDKAPTCTTEGSQSIHCVNCDATKDSEVIPALGHDWGEWETIESPDCDDEGTQQRTCKVCGVTETKGLEANGHTWEDHATVDVAPTCTTEGSQSIHCVNCSATKNSEIIPALGHDWGEWETIESPDCEDEGTQQRTCKVCGITETKGLEANGHTWEDHATVDVAPTCTTEGSQSIHCVNCSATKDSEVIPALGHDWGEWETIDSPDCDDEGTQQRTCKVCGVTETKGLEANGHTWEDHATVDVEPTCTTEGSQSIHCVNCSATKDSEVIPALGHDWGEWETIESPDCDDEGTQQRTCKVCGVTETKGLEANGHTWEDHATVDVEPTCTTEGSQSIHCVNCSATKDSEVIPALGHDWGEWETIDSPDCDDEGTQQRTCKVCGVTETKGLEANGHTWEDHATVDVEPTCTTEGSQSIHCVNCSATKDSEVIPALGHDWGEWETIESPDCDDEGTQQRICKVCGVTETKGLAANGHDWEDHYTVDKEMTCLTDGSESIHCKNCDAVKDSRAIPAPGHHTPSSELVGEKPATPTEDGYTGDVVCEVCGETLEKGEVIPATQGDLEFVPETDENAPSVEMTDEDIKDFEDAVLTDEDKAARDEGADIKVVLSVKDGTDSVSDSDKQLAEELIGEDYVLGQYLEIDITKYVDSTATIVTQLSKAVKITLAIPESLLGGKTYAVVRVHDGKAEILADIDDDPATITFLTDKFSAYAVVYVEDEIATPPDDTTKPDDTTDNDVPPATGSTLPVIPFVVTALAVTVLGISKKNRK